MHSAIGKLVSARWFPLFFFTLLNVIFFWPFFFEGKIPVDANPLYRSYPWTAYDTHGLRHEVNPAKHYHNIDAALSLYPLRKEVRRQIRSGEFPFWTGNIFSGTQLVGTQVAVFDVLTPLYYVLPEGIGHGSVIILQFILAGWFISLFCESLGLSRAASLMAGIAFMWNSHFMRWFGTISYNATLCWLPLILYGVNQYAKGKRYGFHIVVFALVAQFFGDHPQLWIYNVVAFGTYALFQIWKLPNRLQLAMKFAAAFLLSLLIASPELFSVASALKNSPRGSSETAEMYGGRNFLSPRKLPTLFVPDLFGQTENNVFSKLLLRPPLDKTNGFWGRLIFGQPGSVYNRVLAYIGLLPFLFALLSIHIFIRRAGVPAGRHMAGMEARPPNSENWKSGYVCFFWLVALIPLVFLTLTNFKIFNDVISWFWSGARTLDHSRILVLCVFSFSILSAFGLDLIQSELHRRTAIFVFKISAAAFVIILVVILLGSMAGNFLQHRGLNYYSQHLNSFPWNQNAKSFYTEAFATVPSMFSETAKILVLPTLIALGTFVVVTLLARGKLQLSFCFSLIIALTILDLLYHGRTDPPVYFTSPEFFEPKEIESLDFLQKHTETSRVLEIQRLKPFLDAPLQSYSLLDEYYTRGVRFFDFNSFDFVARPDSLLHYSIPTASGYLGFYPSRYFRLHHGRPNDILQFVKPDQDIDTWNGGWIDMQAIRYILTIPGTVSQRYPVAHYSKGLTIFENKNAVPLVYLSKNIKVMNEPDKSYEYIHSNEFNPNELTVLEQDPGKVESSKGSVIIAQKKSSSLLVAVLSEFDSIVVFAENYYPGWRAFVDGKQVPIYRANYTFQAVRVPAGKHTVKFSFEVVYFRLAVALTAIGLLIWFMFFVKLA